MLARWFNVVLGSWLLLTVAFLRPHSPEFPGHVVLGIGVFLVSFVAMGIPRARLVNIVLGILLILWPFVFRYLGDGWGLHDIVVGSAILWLATATPPRLPARRAGSRRLPVRSPGQAHVA